MESRYISSSNLILLHLLLLLRHHHPLIPSHHWWHLRLQRDIHTLILIHILWLWVLGRRQRRRWEGIYIIRHNSIDHILRVIYFLIIHHHIRIIYWWGRWSIRILPRICIITISKIWIHIIVILNYRHRSTITSATTSSSVLIMRRRWRRLIRIWIILKFRVHHITPKLWLLLLILLHHVHSLTFGIISN